MESARVQRVDPVDRLDRGDRTLLLFEHRVVELSPVALAVWEWAADTATLDELAAQAVEEFGSPPGSLNDAVDRLLDELTSLGVLTRTP